MVHLENRAIFLNEIEKSVQIWKLIQDMLLIFKKTHDNANSIFLSVS